MAWAAHWGLLAPTPLLPLAALGAGPLDHRKRQRWAAGREISAPGEA